MEDTRFNYLFERYFKGLTTPEESNEFLDIVEDDLHKEQVQGLMEVYWNSMVADEEVFFSEIQRDHMYTTIFNANRSTGTKPTYKLWPRIAVTAAAVALIVSGVYFFNFHTQKINKDLIAQDIAPGKSGATLTLANGKQIRLADAENGEIAQEAGITVTKTADGQLVYAIKETNNDLNKINTLSTAKGETYQLRLPDGSLVWLNAASSLTYSANLNEHGKRRVKLDGEGYFEIAKDKLHPFVVESKGQQLEVLGTHFNVSSYGDEPVTTTSLLEGSVRINGETVLKPGEQASLSDGKKITVEQVDVDKSVAWKNGKFVFQEENIESIMRKLARWYNVEIIYQGDFSERTFVGTISRYDDISKILDKISFTQAVHFKIEGRRIYVMP